MRLIEAILTIVKLLESVYDLGNENILLFVCISENFAFLLACKIDFTTKDYMRIDTLFSFEGSYPEKQTVPFFGRILNINWFLLYLFALLGLQTLSVHA